MRIQPESDLYNQLYLALAANLDFNPAMVDRYVHRYLEMKKIDWKLWDDLHGDVLDVACDIPLDAIILKQIQLIESIFLVDINRPPRPTIPKGANFVQCDATVLPFDAASFDYTLSFSSIEHLPDANLQRLWIKEMVRVTKPQGKILITVDNSWSWLNRIWDGFRTPMRRISPIELRSWVLENGDFEIEAWSGGGLYYWGFRPSFRGSTYFAYALDRLLKPVSPLLPWLGNRIGYRFKKL